MFNARSNSPRQIELGRSPDRDAWPSPLRLRSSPSSPEPHFWFGSESPSKSLLNMSPASSGDFNNSLVNLRYASPPGRNDSEAFCAEVHAVPPIGPPSIGPFVQDSPEKSPLPQGGLMEQPPGVSHADKIFSQPAPRTPARRNLSAQFNNKDMQTISEISHFRDFKQGTTDSLQMSISLGNILDADPAALLASQARANLARIAATQLELSKILVSLTPHFDNLQTGLEGRAGSQSLLSASVLPAPPPHFAARREAMKTRMPISNKISTVVATEKELEHLQRLQLQHSLDQKGICAYKQHSAHPMHENKILFCDVCLLPAYCSLECKKLDASNHALVCLTHPAHALILQRHANSVKRVINPSSM